MSVVLPAPLAPTRPKTAPRGTVRLTSSSATVRAEAARQPLDADDRVGSAGAGRSWFISPWRVAAGLVAPAEQIEQFVQADVHLPGLGEQGVDALGEDSQALLAGQRRAAPSET